MINWIYKGKEFTEQPEKAILAFVYKISHLNGPEYYIGKCTFWKQLKRPPLKGKKRIRKDLVPSKWKKYWGSSDKFNEFVEKQGEQNFKREILSLHKSKSSVAYEELMQQIKHDVLRDPNSFNGIINVRLSKIKE